MTSGTRLSREDLSGKRPAASFAGRLLILSVFALHGVRKPRYSCSVSKKVAPLAVERNLIKRRCREAVMQHVGSIEKPVGLLFRATPQAKNASFAELCEEVERLLSKVR